MVSGEKSRKKQVSWQPQWNEAYDWAALFAGAGTGSRIESIQAYVRVGLQVTHIPGKGLGLYTAVAASQGELLLVEEAFACGAFEKAVLLAEERLADDSQTVARKLRAQVCALSGLTAQHKEAKGITTIPVEEWGDDLPVWSLSLEEIRDRFARNAMTSVHPVEKPGGYVALETVDSSHTALYPIASLINHDCAPSCNRLPLGSLIVIRAARDLAAGEELTHYYTEIRCPKSIREAELQRCWGFICECKRCVFESGLSVKTAKELDRCHQAFEALKCARQASEADLRRLVRESRRCAERGATTATERAWLMLSAFVPVAFEFGNGLASIGQYKEADSILADVEKTYEQVLSCSTMHAAVAHCRSYFCYCRSSGLLQALEDSVQIHDMCYGGGVRTWRFLTRKALSADVHGLVVPMAAKQDPQGESSAVGKKISQEVTCATVEKCIASNAAVGEESNASIPGSDVKSKKTQLTTADMPSSCDEDIIKTTILGGKILRAEVPLLRIPAEDSIELSPFLIHVGDKTWGLPFEIDPVTAQISWLRKRGILRIEASLASSSDKSCEEFPSADLATLD